MKFINGKFRRGKVLSIESIDIERKVRAFFVLFIVCLLKACASIDAQDNNTLEMISPTGISPRFNSSDYTDFEDYIEKTRLHLEKFKVYFDKTNMADELNAATPYVLKASGNCTSRERATRGIVLMHGLGDMPISMKDLATEFANRCFVVYSLLLPGHGARSSELLDVNYQDWLNASKFAVSQLAGEVDQVFVGGFSLGGLVALKTAIDNNSVSGVVSFSPALTLRRSFMLDQSIWIRKWVDWLDKDPQDDSYRLEAMPFNAVAETQLLSKVVQKNLNEKPLETPVFIVQSSDDAVVNSENNKYIFNNRITNPQSRLLDYRELNSNTPNTKKRIIEVSSVLPEQRILSYSHIGIHVSPDNARYGNQGTYNRSSIEKIKGNLLSGDLNVDSSELFRGEIFGKATRRHKQYGVDSLIRLTFNPQFDSMIELIDNFFESIAKG